MKPCVESSVVACNMILEHNTEPGMGFVLTLRNPKTSVWAKWWKLESDRGCGLQWYSACFSARIGDSPRSSCAPCTGGGILQLLKRSLHISRLQSDFPSSVRNLSDIIISSIHIPSAFILDYPDCQCWIGPRQDFDDFSPFLPSQACQDSNSSYLTGDLYLRVIYILGG